jgi:hypothetical protein
MSFQRRTLAVVAVALLGLGLVGLGANARAADPAARDTIAANVNDPGILTTRGPNLVYMPDSARRVGKLLVFLPSGGAVNFPTEFEWVGDEGARLGYHTIVLAYRNEVGIAAAPPAGCGNDPDPASAPSKCAFNARMELFDGRGESTVVAVDRANSIENRLTKVLQHLAAQYPGENWSDFLDPSGTGPAPRWSEIVIAGHSLGSGQAMLIGQLHSVFRVASFSGFTDASHGWVTVGATPSNRYFALTHQRDGFFARTCVAYFALTLTPSCPLEHFAIPPPVPDPANPFLPDPTNPFLVENRELPFGTSPLVTDLDPAPNPPQALLDPYHPSTTRDGWIRKETDGTPSLKLLNAWRSILGDSDADTYLDLADDLVHADNCPLVANARQDDADGDGTGDACDPTPYGTTRPTIFAPGDITVNATGPSGTTVPYTVTATDDLLPNPNPECAPSAGSLFAIGDTSVTCTATDLGGNTATASFVVTVRGADNQLVDLRTAVDGIGPGYSLINKISYVQTALASNDVPGGCAILSAFVNEVDAQSGKKVPVDTAAALIADASRIQAVLGC